MKSKNALCGVAIVFALQFGVLGGSAQINKFLFSGSETSITLNPGTYIITAYGAPGADPFFPVIGLYGGLGAEMSAEFNFSTSTTLTLLVGGGGNDVFGGRGPGGGGGGGSFVVEGSTPLVIAGGGGGPGNSSYAGGKGNVSTNGGNAYEGPHVGGGTASYGGTNGGGGGGSPVGINGGGGGGGGGGFIGNGNTNTNGLRSSSNGGGGYSFEYFVLGGQGGNGGFGFNSDGGNGGYGGGGGGGGNEGGGGGGGGYSGGGGGYEGGGGGGGGSIIDSSAIAILCEVSGILSPDDPNNGEIIIIGGGTPPTQYVALGSTNPVAPYTSWATAATNIQDAVDVGLPGGTILVTNGTYAPITVNGPVTVQSVNGPSVTVIDGGGVDRCVYLLPDNVVVVGFTLTNGLAQYGGGAVGGTLNNCVLTSNLSDNGTGGGAYSCTLNNCTLTGNSSSNDHIDGTGGGGGAYDCTLNNCTLTGNSTGVGGGAYDCTLNNCTLTGNSAGYGGGAFGGTLNNCTLTGNAAYGGGALDSTLNNCVVSGNTGGGAYSDGGYQPCVLNNCTVTGNSGWGASSATLNNCIVFYNSDPTGGNYDSFSTLNYCCTTPMPINGVGNITNDPLFVDYAGGNLRLQPNSSCINSGNNAYVVGTTDLNGNPRIVGGTVDIGAYEYQTPVSMISYAWLQQYGLPINTNTDTTDLDGTGMNLYQDWVAGLNPTNALSVLKMLRPAATSSPLGLVVSWQSVSNITYFFQKSTNLAAQPAFFTIQSNIVGQAGTTSCSDTNAVGSGPFFYRVGVSN